MKKIIITVICFAFLTACKENNHSQSEYSKNAATLKKLLDSADLSNNYNGSILIADGHEVLIEEAYGFNGNNQEPNKPNSKYGMASMPKMFTAVSIMQLKEKDQISLEQTIGDILTDYPNEEAKKVTVEQLLSHTSGIGDYFGPEYDRYKDSVRSLEDYLPFFASDPLEFEPGERMRYSNGGFVVLGLMIEKISNTDYNTYVSKNILQPTGMLSTGPFSSSAGGGNSTVNDIYKFALALKNNSLISQESLAAMTTDHFGNGYGYGMSLRELNGNNIYGHNGGAPGVAGELDMVKEKSLIIITLSNRSPMDGWAQVRTHIRKEFFGITPQIKKFLNTEKFIKTYKTQGFEKASELLVKLDNNISLGNTLNFAEKYARYGQHKEAIDIAKIVTNAYPDESLPYSFLADFQLQAGQREKAIVNYKKSLEINPQNKHATEKLKELE